MLNPKNIKIGKALADIRRQHGMSQEELADKAKIDYQEVINVENDNTDLDFENFINFAHIYKMHPSQLMLKIEELSNFEEFYKRRNYIKPDN